MALVYLLSLVVILTYCSSLTVSQDEANNEVTGEFVMKAGSTCKYHVINFDDEGIVGFRVKCNCQGIRKELTYSCVYFGKPNMCPGFNETSEARHTFYSELVEYIKGYGGHACSSKEIKADKVTTLCKGHPLVLRRTETINGDDPRTCVMTKWIQQYRAMVVKRYLNFIRFYIGILWQLLLPLLFIILGLVLAGTITTHYTSDPARELSLSLSAPSNNLTLFQANFADFLLPFDYEELKQSPLYGYPNVFNYTNPVLQLKEGLANISNISECCHYKHQILDKYCASFEEFRLMDACQNSEEFGYHYCIDRCLSCCQSKRNQLASCSNPRYQLISDATPFTEASQFCPVTPKLSTDDYTNPYGPLDDIDRFVDEYLLQIQEVDTHFFNEVLGGFTVSHREPTSTVCGCSDFDVNNVECSVGLYQTDLLNSLSSESDCTYIPHVSRYSDDNLNYLDITLSVDDVPDTLNNFTAENAALIRSFQCSNLAHFNCNSYTSSLSSLPTCVLPSNSPAPSICFDTSCIDDDTTNASHSFSAQYNCWQNSQDNVILTVWYNNQAYHLSPAILNVLHNLYLRQVDNFQNHSITVYNHPLPRHPNSTIDATGIDITTFTVGVLSMFGFSFLLASFSLFIVQEKSTKAKHLQLSSGLRLSAYWMANFTWDMITSLIPVILTTIVFAVAQIWVEQYSGTTLLAVMLLFLLVCWAQIPSVYLLSLPFNDIYTAYTFLFLMIFLLSFFSLSLNFLIGTIAGHTMVADILHYIFLVNPSYGLAASLSDLYINHIIRETCTASALARELCKLKDASYTENPFEFARPGVGAVMLYLILEGFIYFSLSLLADHYQQIKQYYHRKKGWTTQRLHEKACKENRHLQIASRGMPRLGDQTTSDGRMANTNRPANQAQTSNLLSVRRSSQTLSLRTIQRSQIHEDESVKNEKKVVTSALKQAKPKREHTVIIGSLSKYYHNTVIDRLKNAWNLEPLKKPAVNNMNMLLRERQCFGLLGYNGAGKSTTFKMLTGEIAATTGIALIGGYDIRTQLRQVQQRIGYCPQFDALIERLTGRELLTMFARLRGINERDIPDTVTHHIETLGLTEHADKQCRRYSGGNKRKLSTAIALIGDPRVILLDEPTSGMDIKTRHNFISTLNHIMEKEKKTIILSSHSMSECESLCNKIAIMINGEFRCIGSTEELKNMYGEQETKLTIRVEHYTYDGVNPLFEATINQPFLHRPSIASDTADGPQHLSSNNILLPNQPSTYSRLKNIGRAFGKVTSSVDFLEDSDDNESIEDYTNPYLQEVCNKVAQYFCRRKDVKKISIKDDEVTYKLPKHDVPLSEIFLFMQQLKEDSSLHIINYSVSQSTLEQVFSYFIKEQEQKEKESNPND